MISVRSSLKSRFIQADLRLVLGLHHGRIDCPHLLSLFGLAVPNRRSRQPALFHVAFGRVNTVKSGLFIRIPVLCNNFLQKIPNADMLAPSNCIHSDVCDFARSQGAYIWDNVSCFVVVCSVLFLYFMGMTATVNGPLGLWLAWHNTQYTIHNTQFSPFTGISRNALENRVKCILLKIIDG